MSENNRTATSDAASLADDARELISATASLTSEKIAAARDRLASAVDAAKSRAIDGAKATDEAIRTYPYHSIAIAFGVGALAGYCLSRRK
jgi:ElaB/YqjD/DUF883 family membrane-anchored ribosome-binding protein